MKLIAKMKICTYHPIKLASKSEKQAHIKSQKMKSLNFKPKKKKSTLCKIRFINHIQQSGRSFVNLVVAVWGGAEM